MGFFKSLIEDYCSDEPLSEEALKIKRENELFKAKQHKRKGNASKRRKNIAKAASRRTTDEVAIQVDILYDEMNSNYDKNTKKYTLAQKNISKMRGVKTYSKIPYKTDEGLKIGFFRRLFGIKCEINHLNF